MFSPQIHKQSEILFELHLVIVRGLWYNRGYEILTIGERI